MSEPHPTITIDLVCSTGNRSLAGAEWAAESSGRRSTSNQGRPPCHLALNPIPPTLRNRQTQDVRDTRRHDGASRPTTVEKTFSDWTMR